MKEISVLINNYNYGKYLDVCIESVLQQTYPNIEVIVYDDGSTDDSLNVLEKYQNQITVISNPNYGQSPHLNQANAIYQSFLRSKGDIICLLDSDDAFHREKIDKVVQFLNENPTIDVVQHPLIEMDGEGHLKDTIRPVLKEVEDYKEYIFSTQNLFHLFAPTSGLVLKKEILNKIIPFQEDNLAHIWSDTRLMLNSVLLGNIKIIGEPLGYYRIHGHNDSGKRGSIEGHQQYTTELYQYFNQIALKYGYDTITFERNQFLKNTYFYNLIDIEGIRAFLSGENKNNNWIWGAGEAGQTVLYALKNGKQKVKGFIDMNPQKRNKIIMDKKVLHPDDIQFSKDMKILVSPYHAYEEISENLRSVGLVEKVNFIFPYKQ